MKFKESELIIQNGRIYHLGLAPEELAPLIITVGDPERVERVSRHFDRIEYQRQKREFVTHTGYIGNKRISVIGTGIGSDNIDIMINETDALINIDFNTRQTCKEIRQITYIRMGTSGALRSEIPVDSLIASSFGMGLDGLLNFYHFTRTEFQEEFLRTLRTRIPDLWELCIPNIFPANHSILQSIGHDLPQGITLTAGGFYAPQGRTLRLPQKMKPLVDKLASFTYAEHKIVNFEMETSSIYGLAGLLGHRALSINAIIANRATGAFSKNPYQTIDKLILQGLERITELN